MKIILILLAVASCCLAVDPVFFTIGFVKDGLFDPADPADLEPCGERTSDRMSMIIQGFIIIFSGKGNALRMKAGLEQSVNNMHGFISILDPCADAHGNLQIFAKRFRRSDTGMMLRKLMAYQTEVLPMINNCLVSYTHGDAAPAGRCVANIFLWLLAY